eukprot:5141504-Amphidinium_carterae.1
MLARKEFQDTLDFQDHWREPLLRPSKATVWDPPPWLALLEEQGSAHREAPARETGLPTAPPHPDAPRIPKPTKSISTQRFGPGHSIQSFQVRPDLNTLHWCDVCGAYAASAIGSLKWACRGERRPGSAAACSRIARGMHPQHALA